MAFSGNQVTRLGSYGGPRFARNGSFAGKTLTEVVLTFFEGLRRNVGRMMK